MKLYKPFHISDILRKKSLILLAETSFTILLIYTLLYFFPLSSNFYPMCPWNFFTNTYCPGCGTLRGLEATIHGDLFGLYKYNKLAFLSSPVLVYGFINLLAKSIFKYHLPVIKLNNIGYLLIIVIIIAYWILRNYLIVLSP